MSTYIKVIAVGHLGQAPEVRSFPNGDKIANFSIATSESWTDKTSGEKMEKTEWHNVAVFNKGLASVCESYLQKGSKVLVEGKLRTRKWTDKAGHDRQTTEILLQGYQGNLTMLDNKASQPDVSEDKRAA